MMENARHGMTGWGLFRSSAWACTLILGAVAAGLAASDSGIAKPGAVSTEELVLHSDWWPEFVELGEAVPSPANPSRSIPAGTRGVLIRVEGDGVLLDFGRNGIFSVPVARTNLRTLVEEKRKQPVNALGLFSGTMFNKFFRLEEGKLRQCLPEDFLGKRYFLILYTRLAEDRGAPVRRAIEARLARDPEAFGDLQVVIIPFDETEAVLAAAVHREDLEWPVMYHFLNRAYAKTLQHDPSGDPTLALIDRNGRLLARLGSEAGADSTRAFLDSLPSVLRSDRLLLPPRP